MFDSNFLPFLEKIPDISTSTIPTRSQEQKQKIASRGEYNRYLRQNGRDSIKIWLEANESDIYFMKESDTFFVVSPEIDSNVNVK